MVLTVTMQLSFTGSVEVNRKIQEYVAKSNVKRVTLELCTSIEMLQRSMVSEFDGETDLGDIPGDRMVISY